MKNRNYSYTNILFKLLIILFITEAQTAQAQQSFVENQYFINPWVYNPSRIAERGFTEISLSYKQQWAGIPGAPAIARLGVHSPLNQNIRIGGFIWNQTEGPFQRIEGLATVAYQINLDKSIDHSFNFGMSVGVGNRSINRGELDVPDDPGLDILPNSSSYLQGSFGLNYRINGFQIGIAAPRLIQDKITGLGGFESPSLGFPEYLLGSISYAWQNPLETFKIEPQLLYHHNNNGLGSQWEGFISAYYKNTVWGGVSYRQDYGLSGYIGAAYKKVDVSYIYSLPSVGATVPNSSHEVVVRLSLGKNRNEKAPKNLIPDEEPEEDNFANNYKTEEEETIPEDVVVKAVPTNPEIASNDTTNTLAHKNKELELTKTQTLKIDSIATKEQWRIRDLTGMTYPLEVGYYMICGAFASRNNALRFETDLESKGLDITTVMVPSRGLYYVYTGYTDDAELAEGRCKNLRQMMGMQDTWILKIYE